MLTGQPAVTYLQNALPKHNFLLESVWWERVRGWKLFPTVPLNSSSPRNRFRDGLRCRASSGNLSRDSAAGPPRLPRRRFRAHSGEEPRAPPPGLSISEPGWLPTPTSRKAPQLGHGAPVLLPRQPSARTLRPAGPARALTWRPKGTAPPTRGRSTKIGKVSESRPAGSQQPSSRSKINLASLPSRGKGRCWKPREEKEQGPPGPQASARWRGRGGG